MSVLHYAGRDYEYGWWSGERLTGTAEKPIAFDCETELIAGPLHVPRLALAMAFDGVRLVLVHPADAARFVDTHTTQHVVGHNVQFDWHVLHEHVAGTTRRRLWDWADKGRVHDTMILDQLLQLATGKYRNEQFSAGRADDDKTVYGTNLGVLAAEAGLEVDKKDEYRTRYGELLGLSRGEIESHAEFEGFASYALKDVIATHAVYPPQRERAVAEMRKAGWDGTKKSRYDIRHDALERWGPLTELIQVRAAVWAEGLSRRPLRIDEAIRDRLAAEIRAKYDAAMAVLEQRNPSLFKRYSPRSKNAGQYRVAKKTGVPETDAKVLAAVLVGEAGELGVEVPISSGKESRTSISTKDWARYAERSAFIRAWVDLKKYAVQLGFFAGLNAPQVYTRYEILKRTGRTSAKAWKAKGGKLLLPGLNIQQMPKGDLKDEDAAHPRDCFVAAPGKKFVIVDYSYLEVRSWAACCLARFGASAAADAVREHTLNGGADPHQRTGATAAGVTLEEFFKLSKASQKSYRQMAKCANFGLPGGLGSEKFVAYAAGPAYGVALTLKQSREIKKAWLATYPEGAKWLADRTNDALSENLGVRVNLGRVDSRLVSDLLRDAVAAGTRAEERAWAVLKDLVTNSRRWELWEAVTERQIKPLRHLTTRRVGVLTGRVRGGCGFTDGCNAPFQGVAADGAKEAVWRLRYAGYDVVAFVHDEVVVEVDARTAERDRKRVEKVMCDAMEDVFGNGVPVAVESVVGDRWVKG